MTANVDVSVWSRRLAVPLVRGVLWAVIVSGPVLGAAAYVAVSTLRADSVHAAVPVEPSAPVDVTGAGGVAELAITSTVPAGWVRTVGVEVNDDTYVAVTVATGTTSQPDAYYTIGIARTDDGWVAVGPPSLIPTPTPLVPDLLVGRLTGLSDVAGLEDAVTGFLTGYLTGTGALDRYTAPTTALTPVVPAPFVSIELVDAGSIPTDVGRLILATVEGTDQVGRVWTTGYSLTAISREGRWEITEVLAAHPLAERWTQGES